MALEVTVLEPRKQTNATPTAVLIFMHGLGDTAEGWWSDMKHWMTKASPTLRVLLPTAPLLPVSLNDGHTMTCWHDIADLKTIDSKDTTNVESIIEAQIQAGIPPNRIMLGGFSQGAAMSLYVGLQFRVPLGGIISLSGYLPARETFAARIQAHHQNVPVFLGHGVVDSVVAYRFGTAASETLQSAGLTNVKLHTYTHLPHTASAMELGEAFEEVVKKVIA